jgi:hypothetical protein
MEAINKKIFSKKNNCLEILNDTSKELLENSEIANFLE